MFNFSNSDYHDKNALLAKIASEPINLEYETRTDLALIMARDELFTQAGGDTLHEMACIRTLPQAVHSQYIYWYKTNIRMRQDV